LVSFFRIWPVSQLLVDYCLPGIPTFTQSEGIHGLLALNATIFNSPIAFACSWNLELIEKMANVIGTESLALGVNQIFAPVVDLARELRFGRVEETFGEDPYLYEPAPRNSRQFQRKIQEH
jgi:beta-glucosidase